MERRRRETGKKGRNSKRERHERKGGKERRINKGLKRKQIGDELTKTRIREGKKARYEKQENEKNRK